MGFPIAAKFHFGIVFGLIKQKNEVEFDSRGAKSASNVTFFLCQILSSSFNFCSKNWVENLPKLFHFPSLMKCYSLVLPKIFLRHEKVNLI